MNRKQTIIIFCFLIVLLTVVIGGVVYFREAALIKEEQAKTTTHEFCLKEDEVADYTIEKKGLIGGVVKVKIQNKEDNSVIKSFEIDDVFKNYYPVELRRCGIYVMRMFNYDVNKIKQGSGFKIEIWRYRYNGEGESVLLLSEKEGNGLTIGNYSYDFRISLDEKYLVLENSYLGKDNYALVIKDLNTKEDLLVFNLKDILAKHPDVILGSFGLGSWTKDGKYLHGDLFQGALSTAYYRVEAGTWKTDIFPAPQDILAGVERAINFKNLYLAYVDIPTFTGVQEVYEQIIEEAKKEGKQKNLYLYNLATKEKVKIASADPEWRFNIQWLSDSELQYELPSGEKRFYMVK